MGRIIDATMIQFRVLNKSRGPAVQAPRAQADKQAYQLLAKQTVEREHNLTVFPGYGGRFPAQYPRVIEITGVITERRNTHHRQGSGADYRDLYGGERSSSENTPRLGAG
jgi:tRNA uridine 5-carboxymethylaminomethyl modification enzyme